MSNSPIQIVPIIQKETLEISCDKVKKANGHEIEGAKFYILVDETSVESKREQNDSCFEIRLGRWFCERKIF